MSIYETGSEELLHKGCNYRLDSRDIKKHISFSTSKVKLKWALMKQHGHQVASHYTVSSMIDGQIKKDL